MRSVPSVCGKVLSGETNSPELATRSRREAEQVVRRGPCEDVGWSVLGCGGCGRPGGEGAARGVRAAGAARTAGTAGTAGIARTAGTAGTARAAGTAEGAARTAEGAARTARAAGTASAAEGQGAAAARAAVRLARPVMRMTPRRWASAASASGTSAPCRSSHTPVRPAAAAPIASVRKRSPT